MLATYARTFQIFNALIGMLLVDDEVSDAGVVVVMMDNTAGINESIDEGMDDRDLLLLDYKF